MRQLQNYAHAQGKLLMKEQSSVARNNYNGQKYESCYIRVYNPA